MMPDRTVETVRSDEDAPTFAPNMRQTTYNVSRAPRPLVK
jgi:hypothetical protein